MRSRDDRATRATRVLRWYPTAWRERYGAELVALLDDTHADASLSVRERCSLARAGIIERWRYCDLVGHRSTGVEQKRAGALLVFYAWACFMVAGAGFAKYSEHWDVLTPSQHRAVPEAAMTIVQVSAFVGAGLCALACVVSWSSWWRLVRASRARSLAATLAPGFVATLVAICSSGLVIVLAHHASSAQRQGVASGYRLVGLTWSALLVVCLAVVSANLGRVVRRLDYSRGQLRALAVLARLLGVVMLVIFAAFVAWWVSIATYARIVLTSGLLGISDSGVSWPMLGSATLMSLGLALATWGVLRSRRRVA